MAIEKTCSTATKIPGSRISFQKLKDCRLAGERLIVDAQPAGCGHSARMLPGERSRTPVADRLKP